jgi:hypothetical protein
MRPYEQMPVCLLVQQKCRVIAELTERHEIQIRGHGATIVFTADSEDGRLVIRRVPDGKRPKDVCSRESELGRQVAVDF